jgi:hypothetical protein
MTITITIHTAQEALRSLRRMRRACEVGRIAEGALAAIAVIERADERDGVVELELDERELASVITAGAFWCGHYLATEEG